MKIWIVCSGQADLALPRRCTARELARWCRQEAEAPWRVQPVQTVPSAGRMVYVSPRRAARESARAFCGQGECQTEPLLDEIPLAPFKEDKRPRPLWLWRLMARLQRRFGRKGQPESRRQAMERAEALIRKLESAGQDCVLVTHPAFLAVLLVMTSAMKGGMLTGAAVGTVLGLAMDISAGGAPFYTMAYSFSGLLSGVFGKHGRLIFVLSFVLSSALAVVCVWNSEIYISALFESFCASVIFMLLPSSLLGRAGLILQSMERGSGESGLRRFVARRVRNLSEAYGELYDIVRQSLEEPYNDENVARVFDRAADEVCVRCRNKNRCWNAEYMDTLSAMNDATRAMVANGSLTAEDLPGHFREKCIGLPAFVAAVNGELRGLSYRRQLRMRLSENRSVAWAQYTDIAQVLGRVADDLSGAMSAMKMKIF